MATASPADLRAGLVGQRIHARRLALDLSREDLAERADSDLLLILAYELGQGLPAPMDMVRIARVLGQPIGFFFGDEPKPRQTARAA